jgi:ABC-2 type transport system permease protein
MKKTLSVLRNELINTLSRRSFLFTAFGLPLIGFLLVLGVSALNSNGSSSNVISELFGSPDFTSIQAQGYIDQAGLIDAIPSDLPPGSLVAFSDEVVAKQALADEEISAYYIIPEDYLESGELIYITPEFNPISDSGQSWMIRWALQVNLLDGDAQLAARVQNPMEVQVTALTDQVKRDESNPLTYWVPYATTIIFYMVILMTSSLLLNSVSSEKQNRVIEILMVSVKPRQLLTGKILGLGIAGLIQIVIWLGTGYTLLKISGRSLNLPAGFDLPISFILWGVLFFILGYAVYASLMATLGALVPNLREASQATIVVIAPLIVPMFFVSILIDQPHGGLATGLSLFPLTAPVTIMTRLAAGGVPLWQPLLSAGLLALTAFVIIRAAAGAFRAQTLLSGQPFSLNRYFAALLGRSE